MRIPRSTSRRTLLAAAAVTLVLPFVPSATSAATNERTQDGETVIFGSSPVDESGTAGADVALVGGGEDVIDGAVDRDGVADGSVGDVTSDAPGADTSAGDPGEALLSGAGDNDMVSDGDGDGSSVDDKAPDTASDTASDTGESGAGTDLCDADPADTMMSGCPIDRSGPSITDVTVDVGADGEVLVRFRASDESGVSRVSSTLAWGGLTEGGGSYLFHPFSVHLETISIERVSGDDLDGIWEQRLRSDIEPYPIRMVYAVWIDAVDGFGDRTFVSAPATASL